MRDFRGSQMRTQSLHLFSLMNFLWPVMSWMPSAAIQSWKTMEKRRVYTSHKFIQCWSLLSPLDFFGLKKPTCVLTHTSESVPSDWTSGSCIVLVDLLVLAVKWQTSYSLQFSFPLFPLVKWNEKNFSMSVFGFTLGIKYGL